MADLYAQADLGEMINEGKTADFVAAEPIAKGQLVKLSTHVAGDMGTVSIATAACLDFIGVAITAAVAIGDTLTVALKNGGGVVKVTNAAGAVIVGTKFQCGATGLIDVFGAAALGDDKKTAGVALMTFGNGDTGLIALIA